MAYISLVSRPSVRRLAIAGLASLCALGSGAALAQTVDATINVTGSITGSTCSLSVSSITLNIGSIDKSTFGEIGDPSAPSPVQNLVTASDPNCTAANASMTFMGDADVDNSLLFAVSGGAAGVGIRLEGNVASPGAPGGWQQAIPNSTAIPLRFALGNHGFRASYVQTTQTITNGAANATIRVEVTYI